MDDNFLFVDQNQNVLTGKEAQDKLQKTSDLKFLEENIGIGKVSRERWELAQSYEKNYWMSRNTDSLDDRNIDHYIKFDKFRSIEHLHFKSAIELGCGPFTNLRIIGECVKIDSCVLEDPLIEDYLTHKNCKFTHANLKTGDFALDPFWLKAIRKATRLFSNLTANKITLHKNIPVKSILNCPIEEINTDEKFDLVVMINVIEHCQDINKIFEIIKKMSTKDTYFIFSDKYYYFDKIKDWVNGRMYEAGHPLLVDRQVVEGFLHENFEIVFEKIEKIKYDIDGFDWSYDSVYFIGKYEKSN